MHWGIEEGKEKARGREGERKKQKDRKREIVVERDCFDVCEKNKQSNWQTDRHTEKLNTQIRREGERKR